MIQLTMNKNSQNGNAIVLIMIAVALFAALGYAFSNTSRTSSKLFTDEEASAYANQIIAYGNEIKSAVKRLQLRGCGDTEISFENRLGNYINASAPADNSCHVFDLAGGGVTWKPAPETWRTVAEDVLVPWFNGETSVVNVGSSESELILYITDLEYSICEEINESVNGAAPSPETISAHTIGFNGTYPNLGDDIGDDAGNVHAGVTTACKDDGGIAGTYYQVLIAR